MMELETRFKGVARGRRVSVKFEAKGFLLAYDYWVGFEAETNTFNVVLRDGGCFEGAYRCIERFIEAEAERLDGVDSVPDDHMDVRKDMSYWIIEKQYDQFRSDLESAITDRISWLERVRPGEGVLGEIRIEVRARSLIGLLEHLRQADDEVRRGGLSPQTSNL
jgi:hypothetical protein